ncbi:hypothetical protein ISU10_02460 [Nocardioides agariphilus]|uniref:RiboL-PSP-HEPN domain-containing protein n=1 Tax=Nocardioides agariphilus TaxID=433664 RepID=A0A930VKQ9_9ACTN|nr:hypothetical protein [Nocardioides agariphilus]MBF4766628.1 hypothetical protein [Nocardioides agariphilus]
MATLDKRRIPKPTALEAFEINMADARHLVRMAQALTNTRVHRMRKELRKRVGEALKVPAKDWESLDCLQSANLFVTFLPGSDVKRSDFDDPRPLLRQALVAACAAGETYLADRAMELVGPLLNAGKATARLRGIPMNLGVWLEIDAKYERKKWGLRGQVIEPFVREQASTAPTKVGHLLSMLGVDSWSSKIDHECGFAKGGTVEFLDRLTTRRNKIAHEGDRSGRGRALLTADEVTADLAELELVIHAIHTVTGGKPSGAGST